jgi:hypothetical protein
VVRPPGSGAGRCRRPDPELTELRVGGGEDQERHAVLGDLITSVDASREGPRTTPAAALRGGSERRDRGYRYLRPAQGQGHFLVPTWRPPHP